MRLRIKPPTSADTTAIASVIGSPSMVRVGSEIERGSGCSARLRPARDAAGHGNVDRRRARGAEPAGGCDDTGEAIERTRRASAPTGSVASTNARRLRAPPAAGPTDRSCPATYGKKRITPGSAAPGGRHERDLDRRAAARGARAATRRAAREAPPRGRDGVAPSRIRRRPSRSRAARASGPRPPECTLPCTRASRRAPREPRVAPSANARCGRSSTRDAARRLRSRS